MPFVSVIVPNYNHERFLKRRIESVLSQTYSHFELIILDDASTDNSREIIEHYRSRPNISAIVYNEKNSGSPFRQWTQGISLSKGEWIWIAESDDEAHPDFLKIACQTILKHPATVLFYCNSVYENSSADAGLPETTKALCYDLFHSTRWNYDYVANGKDEINFYLSKHNTIVNASSVLLNKKALQPILKKLNSLNYFGDWLSYLQIASRMDIAYSAASLNKYRRHPDSIFNKELSQWKKKSEYFIIYEHLQKLFFLKNKTELEQFYIHNYLNFGLKSDSFLNNVKTIKAYFKINVSLAIRVLTKIFLQKQL